MASVHKTSVNGRKRAAADHDSVIDVDMGVDDEGDNNNKVKHVLALAVSATGRRGELLGMSLFGSF
ncbi:hypothetical protein BDN67DRAFT_1070882 [Paxillus ammoniavirescens]|nr:hypothetical protein BDN67DRAFT_1070882 [Paxillus ammoniavirescens]